MRTTLLGILLLATFAAANTCTEAVFKLSKKSMDITKGEAYHDSSYFMENYYKENPWSHKLYYTNGKLDSLVMDPMEEGDSLRVTHYYWNADETKLSGKGSEIIILQETLGDTVILNQKSYSDGEFDDFYMVKMTDSYISAQNDVYHSFEEIFFSHDTLFEKNVYDYGSENPRPEIIFTVGDSTNDLKCYEYRMEDDKPELYETIEIINTDNGYMLKYLKESSNGYYLREFFYVNNESTTAIQKFRAPIKISPKARYFDLLGRYKFTR